MMSLQNPGSFHFQGVWRERAADIEYPLWQRVAFIAFGSHRKNLHANFARGELAILLGAPGSSQLSRALRKAKDKGLLAEESEPRCLVLRPHSVQGGLGYVNESCAIHHGKRTGRKRKTPLTIIGKHHRKQEIHQ